MIRLLLNQNSRQVSAKEQTKREGEGECSHSSFTFCLHVHTNILQTAPYISPHRWLKRSLDFVFSPCTFSFYCLSPNSAPILLHLWWVSWTLSEPLQPGRALRGNETSEGMAMPLTTAPVISKESEKQFGWSVIRAGVTEQIFQTLQRPQPLKLPFSFLTDGLTFTIRILILWLKSWQPSEFSP